MEVKSYWVSPTVSPSAQSLPKFQVITPSAAVPLESTPERILFWATVR